MKVKQKDNGKWAVLDDSDEELEECDSEGSAHKKMKSMMEAAIAVRREAEIVEARKKQQPPPPTEDEVAVDDEADDEEAVEETDENEGEEEPTPPRGKKPKKVFGKIVKEAIEAGVREGLARPFASSGETRLLEHPASVAHKHGRGKSVTEFGHGDEVTIHGPTGQWPGKVVGLGTGGIRVEHHRETGGIFGMSGTTRRSYQPGALSMNKSSGKPRFAEPAKAGSLDATGFKIGQKVGVKGGTTMGVISGYNPKTGKVKIKSTGKWDSGVEREYHPKSVQKDYESKYKLPEPS